jgi:CheY-like chemotaxis protein
MKVLDATLGARSPLHILLVEDHPANQKMTQFMLSKFGYEVHIVANGQSAVEAVLALPYDLILMDLQIPGMDGLETSCCIRRLDDRIHQPRIVAMTANFLESDREACLGAGMDDFLPKPVRPADLKMMLERCASALGRGRSVTCGPDRIAVQQEGTNSNLDANDEVLSIYIAEFHTTLQDLRQAKARGDLAGFRKKAHYLKGGSQMIGATTVVALCQDIETASDLTLPVLDDKLAALQEALEEVVRFAKRLQCGDETARAARASGG